jgi:hypothetical protein
MDSISPVLTEAEIPSERVVALGQDDYYPIIVVRVSYSDAEHYLDASLTRYRFSSAERALIAAGADLILGQPHHGPMMPVSLQLALPGEYPVQEGKG